MSRSYSDAERLRWDPFEGERDVDIRNRNVKIVTTRVPHKCAGYGGKDTEHMMEAGTRARFESAIVDGAWGRYYICCACMDLFIEEMKL